MPAVVAGLDVTAQCGYAAVLDSRHDFELAEAQMPGMGCAIRGPGATEDVGDLACCGAICSRPALGQIAKAASLHLGSGNQRLSDREGSSLSSKFSHTRHSDIGVLP